MCISMKPSAMADTKLYAGDAEMGGKYVHVLAYQNKATSQVADPRALALAEAQGRHGGPNAMLLPLPAERELGPDNVLDTRSYPHFLDDISRASQRVTRGGYRGMKAMGHGTAAQVFDVGSYTVVLAKDPAAVLGALERVAPARRPTLNAAVVDSFGINYPGHHLAVCCWSGAVDAEPLLWWYEPMFPQKLFAPALDAHDGMPPRLGAEVDVDHVVSFGSTLRPGYACEVRYSDDLPAVARALLPSSVSGTKVTGRMANGDFVAGVGNPQWAMRDGLGGKNIRLNGWT